MEQTYHRQAHLLHLYYIYRPRFASNPQCRLKLAVWGTAALQIFYSVGMGWGGIITMSSYNRFKNNIYRDAMIVPLINCGTSIFAGFVIFSVIGFMAHSLGVAVPEVVTQGPGIIFVVYPAAIAQLPVSPLWAILFFLMVFTIGLDSQFGMFETMTSAFVDEFEVLRGKYKKVLVLAVMCLIELVIGFSCVFQGGMYVLQLMDWYCSVFSIMVLVFLECVVVAWVYGVNRFYVDIEQMIGYQPCLWWKLCWCFITPFTIIIVLVFSLAMHEPISYGEFIYPSWAVALGWVMAASSVIPIPVLAAVRIIKVGKGSFWQRLKAAARPSEDYGPMVEEYRTQWVDAQSKVLYPRFGLNDLPFFERFVLWRALRSDGRRQQDINLEEQKGALLKERMGNPEMKEKC